MNTSHVLKYMTCWVAVAGIWTTITAQAPSAAGVFDRQPVAAGDTFVLRVLVSGTEAKPDRVNFAPWSGWIPRENILRQSGWQKNGAQWVSNYTLIAFDSVHTELPPLPILLLSGVQVPTQPMSFTVVPADVTADVAAMAPIRPIQPEPLRWTDLAFLLGLLLLGWVVWRYFFGKKKKAPAPPPVAAPAPVAPEPPHVIALQKLARLSQEKPWKKGEIKQFYVALSAILNEYLEHRYQIPAMESTTKELAVLLRGVDFPPQRMDTLWEVLHQADMAKYAQDLDPQRPHERYLLQAEQLIQQTSQQPS